MAAAYLSKGMVQKAVDHYEMALRLKPDHLNARLNLGLIYLKKGDTENARRQFQSALSIDPGNRDASRHLNGLK
jgi:Tfp pilus assembly protein PilF